jgi:ATP-dependent Clp protease ATP-binding subunit ClpB
MTSNLGSHLIQQKLLAGESADGGVEAAYDDLRIELSELLRQSLRPEFLNRVDEIILFKLLGAADLRKIVDLQLVRVRALLERKGVALRVTEEAKDWIAKLGYDPAHGARPLKRVIQKHIVNQLSEKILSGEIRDKDDVEVRVGMEGMITISVAARAAG